MTFRRSAAVVFIFAALLEGCGGGGDSNRGILSFTSQSFSIGEDGAILSEVTVQRLGGDGAVGATITLTDGSGNAPVDYDATPIVVSWDAGDLSDKTITITIFDDTVDEPDETVLLELTNPTGGATIRDPLGDATLNIVDDDVAGTIQFLTPVFFFGEDGLPLGLEITVVRSGGMDGDVSASIATADDTANSDPASSVEPVDYVPLMTTVTFPDQDVNPVVVSLTGTILQDLLPEIDEAFMLTLSAPTGGAVIGNISTATVTIFDDDPILEIQSPGGGTLFGAAVAKLGRNLVIGAPGHAAPSGRAYVIDLATVAVSDTIMRPFSTQFGRAVSVAGTTLAIGGSGNVWVLDGTTLADRFSTSSTLAGFGTVLHAIGDGRLAVGAPDAAVAGGATPAGAVRIFDDVTGALLQPIDGAGDVRLGAALASFANELVIGAPGAAGSVFRYAGDPFSLALTLDNPAPQAMPTGFGSALAISATTIWVGAPDEDDAASIDAGRVYAFSASGVVTAAGNAPGARFGANLLHFRDRLAIFAPGAGPSGSGQVDVWDQDLAFSYGPIDDPAPSPGADFGAALCEFDGALVIGAPRQDTAGGIDQGAVFIVRVN